MKKILSLLIVYTLFIPFISGQTVDSIRFEQAGDFVKVRYKILNSNQDQIFRVKILCSINGGMKSELRSVTGDVGEKVIGGKSEYWIVWDALKDVDEISTADFFIRADLIKDEAKNVDTKPHFYVMPVFEFGDGVFYGARGGIMGDWGGTARFTRGARGTEASNYEETYDSFSFSGDLTRRIINKENFQLHILAGVARSKFETVNRSTSEYSTGTRWGPEIGLLSSVHKIAFSVAITLFTNVVNGMEITSSPFYVNAGIGIKF